MEQNGWAWIDIWGSFEQIVSRSILEYFIKKSGTPRSLWNAASETLIIVGYAIMAMAIPRSLYIDSVI